MGTVPIRVVTPSECGLRSNAMHLHTWISPAIRVTSMITRRVAKKLATVSLRDEITWILHTILSWYLGYYILVPQALKGPNAVL